MTDVGNETLGMLTRERVAELLNLSVKTVDRRIRSGLLAAVKDGSRVLIAPEAVADYKARLRTAGKPAAA